MAENKTLNLSDGDIQAAAAALAKTGARPLDHNWLSVGQAFDLIFEGGEGVAKELLERAGFSKKPVDCIVQDTETRKKKLFVADMDSTMIAQECIDEIAAELDLKDKVAPITEAAMQGKLDFAQALARRVKLLKGLDKKNLEHVLKNRITFNPGAKTLIGTLKAEGVKTVLVSGGFDFFTGPIARALGFDLVLSNRLEFQNGRLTGQVMEPIVDSFSKRKFLQETAQSLGLEKSQSLALGDGANDIPMFEAAGFSIAYHGKKAAREAARGQIDHVDLSGVLFALGIPKKRFKA